MMFLVEVRNPRLPEDWLPALLERLRAEQLCVEVWLGGLTGSLSDRWASANWAAAVGVEEWRAAESDCPYLGPVVGLLAVWLDDDSRHLDEIMHPLMWAAMGGVYRRDDDGELDDWGAWRRAPLVMHAVGQHEFRLSDVLSKYGFGDGDRLLCKEQGSPELVAVYDTLRAAVLAAGLTPTIGYLPTSHNPVRMNLWYDISPGGGGQAIFHDTDGRRVDFEAAYDRLDAHRITLWAFFDDFEGLG